MMRRFVKKNSDEPDQGQYSFVTTGLCPSSINIEVEGDIVVGVSCPVGESAGFFTWMLGLNFSYCSDVLIYGHGYVLY